MKVRCRSTPLTADQHTWLKSEYAVDDYLTESALRPGFEYVVYGVSMSEDGLLFIVDLGDLRWSYEPALLFEIIDPTVSQHWHLHIDEDGTIDLAPAVVFDHPHLLEDAGEGVPEAVALFRTMETLMRAEFQNNG